MTHRDQPAPSTGEGHFVIGVCILLLALSVFGWGLHSKLSLYHVPAHATATTPIAKLLSERERPAPQAQHCDINQPDVHAVAVAAVFVLLPSVFLSSAEARTQPPIDVPPPSHLSAIAFPGPSLRRPPPSLAA